LALFIFINLFLSQITGFPFLGTDSPKTSYIFSSPIKISRVFLAMSANESAQTLRAARFASHFKRGPSHPEKLSLSVSKQWKRENFTAAKIQTGISPA